MKQGELTISFQAKKMLITNTHSTYQDVYYTIDGYDYGIALGGNVVDALMCPLQNKEMITNESRIENGARILVNRNIAPRNLTLKFNIHGTAGTPSGGYIVGETYKRRLAFFKELISGRPTMFEVIEDNVHYRIIKGSAFLDLSVEGAGRHRLVYTGKSVSYNHSFNGEFGVIQAQFYEPNPNGTIDTRDGSSENIHIGTI